jgi:hypothetical protein
MPVGIQAQPPGEIKRLCVHIVAEYLPRDRVLIWGKMARERCGAEGG